jgi:hypothetical protein
MHGVQGVAIMSIKDGIKPLTRQERKVSIDRIERELKDLRDKLEEAIKRGRWVDVEKALEDLDFIIELIESYDPWVDIDDEEFHYQCEGYCYQSIDWATWCFEEHVCRG